MINSYKILRQMLGEQSFIMLSANDSKGFPNTRAMINIHNPQIAPHLKNKIDASGKEIFFITNTSSAKIKHIKKNKKACVYFYDAKTFTGLMLLGEVKEVLSPQIKHGFWHKSWVMYYPEGETGGDFSLLKFTPKTYRLYCGGEGFHKEEGPLKFK